MSPICSDHSNPCIYLHNTVPKPKPFRRQIFNYGKLNCEQFRDLLTDIDWTALLTHPLDTAVDLFSSTLLDIAKKCMPVKNVLIRPNDAPWLNDEIRLLIAERKKLHSVAKQSDLPQDWAKFRKARNTVVSKIKDRKMEFLENLNAKASNPETIGKKDWWHIVKQFLSKKKALALTKFHQLN